MSGLVPFLGVPTPIYVNDTEKGALTPTDPLILILHAVPCSKISPPTLSRQGTKFIELPYKTLAIATREALPTGCIETTMGEAKAPTALTFKAERRNDVLCIAVNRK